MHPTITQQPQAVRSMHPLAMNPPDAELSRKSTHSPWNDVDGDIFKLEGNHQAPGCLGQCLPTWAALVPPLVGAKKKHTIDRDYDLFPTIIDVPQAPQHMFAVSDGHGDYDRLIKLLEAHNLITVSSQGDVHWAGGTAHTIVCGDMIDKGPKNLEMLELMQILQSEAQKAGGQVTVLLGNHEVQFLANPFNDKSKGPGGIFWDLSEFGIDVKTFASDRHPTGYWLRRLPFGVRVGDWFFAHGGQTSGRSLEGLRLMLQVALDAHGFKDVLVSGPNSLVRGRNWYGSDAAKGQENASLLGVRHIVFGHDPDTIAPRGEIVGFPANHDKQLFRIDTGLSVGVNYSHGEMLHIEYTEKGDLVHACLPNGKSRFLGLFSRSVAPQSLNSLVELPAYWA